jgi:hypothetical protein
MSSYGAHVPGGTGPVAGLHSSEQKLNGIMVVGKIRGGGGSVTTAVRAAGEVFDARDFL